MAEIIAGEVQSMYVLGDHRVPMMSSWFYKAAHPLALTVTFHIPTHPQVEWTFARELLLDTIYGGTSTFRGEGDVGFKRVDFHDRSVVIYLYIRSPFGAAVIAMDAVLLYKFAKRTADAVPVGEEPPDEDLAEEIKKLDNCIW